MPLPMIARQRLAHQQILKASFTRPAEVVSWMGAMQAQDYRAGLWAIGLRTSDSTEATVEAAIVERTIVRSWPMRGTIHFAASADIHWMIELLAPRIIARSATRARQLELDAATFTRSERLLAKEMAGPMCLTRDETYAVLEGNHISTANQRGYHILWRLALEGVLCFGPRQGKQPTFTLLNQWVPKAKSFDQQTACSELTKRYFQSHGPASLDDFAWWSGLKKSDARTGIEACGDALIEMKVGDESYWMPAHPAGLPEPSSNLHLLPGFDEFLIAYARRDAVIDREHSGKITPGNNGIFLPMIVSNGRVVGTWKRALTKSHVVVSPVPFVTLKKDELKAFASAACRYGRFLGLSPTVAPPGE